MPGCQLSTLTINLVTSPFKTFIKCCSISADISMDELMIPIPGGQIALRDDRLKTKWTTQLEPFSMAKYPVTQELYLEISKAAPSTLIGKRKPVETVTWKDAVDFCDALSLREGLIPFYSINTGEGEIPCDVATSGYRLPTEAEWEYACKAGTTGVRYGELDKIAWYKENSQRTSHEGGLKEPNPWGLYDMLGNVWEWCRIPMIRRFMVPIACLEAGAGTTIPEAVWPPTVDGVIPTRSESMILVLG